MLQKIDDAFESDISSKLDGQGTNYPLRYCLTLQLIDSIPGWIPIPIVAMCRRVVGDLTILHVLGDTLGPCLLHYIVQTSLLT